MEQVRDVLDFNFSEYASIEEWVNGDDMFWGDLTLHIEDTTYIYDAYNGLWYTIETKYHYADIGYLLENDYKVNFWLVDDEDIHKELDELFNK